MQEELRALPSHAEIHVRCHACEAMATVQASSLGVSRIATWLDDFLDRHRHGPPPGRGHLDVDPFDELERGARES